MLLTPDVPEEWVSVLGALLGVLTADQSKLQTQLKGLLLSLADHHLDQAGDGIESLTRAQLIKLLHGLRRRALQGELPNLSVSLRIELRSLEERRLRWQLSPTVPSTLDVAELARINIEATQRVVGALCQPATFAQLLSDIIKFLRNSPAVTREFFAAKSAFDFERHLLFSASYAMWTEIGEKPHAVSKGLVAFTDQLFRLLGHDDMSERALRQGLNAERRAS